MPVQHCGTIPDIFRAYNAGFTSIYPGNEGRLKEFFQEVDVPHERENRIVTRPQVWLFFNEQTTFHQGLEVVNHHQRGIQTGNRLDLHLFETTIKEMGFIIWDIHAFVPCSNGQKRKLKVTGRPHLKKTFQDYPEMDLRQLHPARLPLDRIKLIESFWRYAPDKNLAKLKAILNGKTAA